MLSNEGRYKWEASVENFYFDEISVYCWKDACVTPTGLVYRPYVIYPGDSNSYPYWNSSTVTIYTPLQQTDQVIAIPLPNTDVFMNQNVYILYYLSRILRFLKVYPAASFWIPHAYQQCLSNFMITSVPLFLSNDTACYAKEVIGYLPGPHEIGKEEITVLREHLSTWKSVPTHKRCVVIGEFHHKKELNELLYKDWFIEYAAEATVDIAGVSLCIVTDPSSRAWSTLWALPKGAVVLEFQPEVEVCGDLQHIAHISELRSWVFLLSKGSIAHVQKQVMNHITKWVLSHEDEIEIK
jgi:hypothetical protein